MKSFTRLYYELDDASQPTEKVALLEAYFRQADPPDAAWALQFLCGRKFPRVATSATLRAWALEEIKLPSWLFDECQDTVGDLAETIALLLPDPESMSALPLHELVERRLLPLRSASESTRRDLVRQTWQELDARERLIWNKLVTGGFHVGVSERLVAQALAEIASVEVSIMAHRLAGDWQPTAESYLKIIRGGVDSRQEVARTYPFCVALPIKGDPSALGNMADWLVEWAWGGIRVQLIRRQGEVLIWSHGDEMVTAEFPEIAEAGRRLPDGTVLDGQILSWQVGRAQPVGKLPRRVGWKNVSAKLRAEHPVMFIACDLLEYSGEDWRACPLLERRRQLEVLMAGALCGDFAADSMVSTEIGETPDLFGFANTPLLPPAMRISESLKGSSWAELAELRKESRTRHVEGLTLKRRSSAYGAGRQRGDWWYWNVDPLVMDAVLIGAQVASGGRADLCIDFVFGVWHEGKLTTVAKANSGLSDAEIVEVDGFVRANIIGKFGPMRAAKPALVFELAFDDVQPSVRHKSGLILRRPRINRWRRDKTAEEAGSLKTLRAMMVEVAEP